MEIYVPNTHVISELENVSNFLNEFFSELENKRYEISKLAKQRRNRFRDNLKALRKGKVQPVQSIVDKYLNSGKTPADRIAHVLKFLDDVGRELRPVMDTTESLKKVREERDEWRFDSQTKFKMVKGVELKK